MATNINNKKIIFIWNDGGVIAQQKIYQHHPLQMNE
jgi:hypothetical protein